MCGSSDIKCVCRCPACGRDVEVERPAPDEEIVIAYCDRHCRDAIQRGHPNRTPTVELPALC